MSATRNTRAEQLAAVNFVLSAIPDRAAQREVLDALFAAGRKQQHRGLKGREPRNESGLKPHGTEAAYQRHKARGEKACEPCLAAANAARAESPRRMAARRKAEAAAKQAA